MKLDQLTIQDFIKELASDAPTPGGGSIAALCGALGAALSEMVAGLTVGKEKYRKSWKSMTSVRRKASGLSERFLHLMQEDTDAYNAVTAAFQLPRSTDDEQTARRRQIQEAMKLAATVPLETMKSSLELAELGRLVVENGNKNAVTDAGAALQLARAAGIVASYNVLINLSSIRDKNYVLEKKEEVNRLLEEAENRIAEAEKVIHEALT
jgi:glutamate formiminotransferase/formiminotetrahydrofolate cyclodeaminase